MTPMHLHSQIRCSIRRHCSDVRIPAVGAELANAARCEVGARGPLVLVHMQHLAGDTAGFVGAPLAAHVKLAQLDATNLEYGQAVAPRPLPTALPHPLLFASARHSSLENSATQTANNAARAGGARGGGAPLHEDR